MHIDERNSKCFHTGVDDGLVPVKAMDLSKINDIEEFLNAMAHTAFGGRRVGEALSTLLKMIEDKDTFVALTLSGAMTIAKMGLIICDLIDRGYVHAIVSTGALMTHGLVEVGGMTHFKYDPSMNDEELFKRGYNRVYDTLELETNLDDIEGIMSELLEKHDFIKTLSSRKVCQIIGAWLNQSTKERGILKSAYEMNVPVYIPAFTDSEMGLDFGIYNRKRVQSGLKPIAFDPFIDLNHCTELVNRQKSLGIVTIGGGVPRNWFQQVACNLDLISRRMPKGEASQHIVPKRIKYALRICPEPDHWGGMSGCTYSEGVSWGKFVPKSEGGVHSEVLEDATVALPMLIWGVLNKHKKESIKVSKNFDMKEELLATERILNKLNLST